MKTATMTALLVAAALVGVSGTATAAIHADPMQNATATASTDAEPSSFIQIAASRTRTRARVRTAKPRRKLTATRRARTAKRDGTIVVQGKKIQVKGNGQQAAPSHDNWIILDSISTPIHRPGTPTPPPPPPPPPPQDDCMSCD